MPPEPPIDDGGEGASGYNSDGFAGTPIVAGPAFAAPERHDAADLSAAIIEAVSRRAGEQVRCRRIHGNRYRCNWWGHRNDPGPSERSASGVLNWTTCRVVRSQMLRVTNTPDGLVIVVEPDQ